MPRVFRRSSGFVQPINSADAKSSAADLNVGLDKTSTMYNYNVYTKREGIE
jgi:hypothetical protein